MNYDKLAQLLKQFKSGGKSLDDVIEEMKMLPFEDIDIATLDNHRELRTGFPEVILAAGKSEEQIYKIVENRLKHGSLVFLTRISEEVAKKLERKIPGGKYYAEARAVTYNEKPDLQLKGKVLVITAGTSDIPVAEEAALTARLMGSNVERLYDVGVAGLHRLLGRAEAFKDARAIIVVAGMEGALPSVVGGLVAVPVIAVPTSVGYGASFGGITALLGMLNSCANGVAVVNIDNGFGAGYTAALINRIGEQR
jgi:NCAIR mutase (PurE)-related protein